VAQQRANLQVTTSKQGERVATEDVQIVLRWVSYVEDIMCQLTGLKDRSAARIIFSEDDLNIHHHMRRLIGVRLAEEARGKSPRKGFRPSNNGK
jgi:hypothetical protein